MRYVMTRVLPEPAPARISSGPSRCSTASRCSGFSLSRKFIFYVEEASIPSDSGLGARDSGTSLSARSRRTLQALLQPPEHLSYTSESFLEAGEIRRTDVAETQDDLEIRVELTAGP